MVQCMDEGNLDYEQYSVKINSSTDTDDWEIDDQDQESTRNNSSKNSSEDEDLYENEIPGEDEEMSEDGSDDEQDEG
ncbi:hypothetical protein C0995_014567 [Termitomyces sp. Mi166|nr:hypothetical protein C0995_014567 [Termitomyces sp. Mi166\